MVNYIKRDDSSHDIHKNYWEPIAMKLAVRVSVFVLFATLSSPTANADVTVSLDCTNLGRNYITALANFSAIPTPTRDDFRAVKRERKLAERQYRGCTKEINKEFKLELKRIKELYPKVEGQTELNLRNKAEKDKAIAAAIIARDSKIQGLPILPSLPFFQR